jgi:hypothetical protein
LYLKHCIRHTPDTMTDTRFRISTMTQVGAITSHVLLERLFQECPLTADIPYLKYGDQDRGTSTKKTQKVSKPVNDTRKHYFFNQVTLHVNVGKFINLKIFNNGGIQMTGLKEMTQGPAAIAKVLAQLGTLTPALQSEILYTSVGLPICESTRMVMINSDFDIGHRIDREKLHREIIRQRYYSSYESAIYPGVNIKYYYNPAKQQTGICNCEGPCDGKGSQGFCKKITIAVFKSGKIIITGGNSMVHIHTAYEFITRFAKENPSIQDPAPLSK